MIFEILAIAALLGVIGCFAASVLYKRETEIELNAKNTRLAALALSIEAQHENAEAIQKELTKLVQERHEQIIKAFEEANNATDSRVSSLSDALVEARNSVKELNERFIRLEAAMETAAENERKFQDGLNNLLNYDITTAFGGGNG